MAYIPVYLWQQGGAIEKTLLPFMAAEDHRQAVFEDMRRVYRILDQGQRELVAVFQTVEDAAAVVKLHNESVRQIQQINADLKKLVRPDWEDPVI